MIMNQYGIKFETKDGEIWEEVVYADDLKSAKKELKEIYNIKRFL